MQFLITHDEIKEITFEFFFLTLTCNRFKKKLGNIRIFPTITEVETMSSSVRYLY